MIEVGQRSPAKEDITKSKRDISHTCENTLNERILYLQLQLGLYLANFLLVQQFDPTMESLENSLVPNEDRKPIALIHGKAMTAS